MAINKDDYIRELQARIAHLPDEERDTALTYYIEYLEDVGEANIQQAMAELGSPREVAERIIADYAQRNNTNNNGHNPFSSGSYRQQTPPYTNPCTEPRKEKGGKGCLVAFLIVITSVIWLPILLAVIGVGVGILLGIIGVLLGLAISAIGFFGFGIAMIFESFSTGIGMIGMGLLLGGLFLLSMIPTGLLFGRFFPWLFRTISGKKKENAPRYEQAYDPGPYADSFRQQKNGTWVPKEEPAPTPRPQEPEYHSPFGNEAPPEKQPDIQADLLYAYQNPFEPKKDIPDPKLETPGADAKAPQANPELKTDTVVNQKDNIPETTLTLDVDPDDRLPEVQLQKEETISETPSTPNLDQTTEKNIVELVNDWDREKVIDDTITLIQDVEDSQKEDNKTSEQPR